MSFRRFLTSASLLALVSALALPVAAQRAQPVKTRPLGDGIIKPIAPSQVLSPVKSDSSPELRNITPRTSAGNGQAREMRSPVSPSLSFPAPPVTDAVVQATPGAEGVMPAPSLTFEGGSNAENGALFGFILAPPDTNGDVGPSHYVQTVNIHFSVYSKAGARLYGPAPMSTLWTGFGGACETNENSDPVVVYDGLADRWLMTILAFDATSNHQCIALSQTGDPLGAWYRWDYNFGGILNDYPKWGVWPNAYTMTANEFYVPNGTGYAGGVLLFQRDRMLVGLPNPAVVRFDLATLGTEFFSILPVDVDGSNPPPAGAPALFVNVSDNTQNVFGQDVMFGFEALVNWANPGASILAGQGFTVAPFNVLCPSTRNCIAQPGTSQKVDALSPRAMFRAAYRNFGTHQSIVASHTVDAGGGVAGVRWYELRQPNGLPWTGFSGANIYQQSTYAPADGTNRWMGSIAMDREGGMAVGYSVSNASVYPGIRYAGRLANDTLNALNQTETTMYAGAGSQLSVNRWGDYSSMSVDPTDDCTFYYTQQYVAATGSYAWNTRVGAFKFPTCVSAASVQGGIQGTVTASGMPVQGALITVGGYTTSTNAAGFYSLPNILAGTYSASAAKYGYNTATASPVVAAGATTTQDFALTMATTVVVEGYVTDGTAHVYGLYAKVTVSAGGLFPGMVTYTDPLTGYYKLNLVPAAPGYPYLFSYESIYPGYLPDTRGPLMIAASTVLNVPLSVGIGACAAPGYQKSAVTPVYTENFDTTPLGTVPAGFTSTQSNASYPWNVQDAAGTTWGFPPYSAPNYLWFDSWNALAGETARIFNTVPLDLTGKGVALSFYMFHDSTFFAGSPDRVQVQVSTDGGFNWQDVGAPAIRPVGDGYLQHTIYVDGYTGSRASVLVALQAISEWGDEILVDNVTLTTHNCTPIQGGMVVGNVYDANTGAPLNEAMVSHDLGGATYTFPTTGDSAQDDGFYFLFAPIPGVPPAARNITASKGSYNSSSSTIIIPADGVIRQNFALTAGAFTISPSEIRLRVDAGLTGSAPLTLQNGGTASATFSILERILPPATYFPGVRPYGVSGFRAAQRVPAPAASVTRASALGAAKAKAAPNAAGVGPAYPGTAREGAVAVSCDEFSYYVFGGLDDSGLAQSDAYEYDVTTGTWAMLPSMPMALYQVAGGCVNGMIYLGGGLDDGGFVTNAFLTFDTITDKWTTSTLPAVRWGAKGAVAGGKFFIIGGADDTYYYSTVWMYDPSTGTFSNMALMPDFLVNGDAVSMGQYIYYIGGSNGVYVNTVHRYDTVANTWSTGAPLPLAMGWHSAFSYGDYLYVASGYDGSILTDTIRYNPSTWPAGSWSVVPTAALPVPVISAPHTATNNKLFVVAGYNGTPYITTHQFIDDGFITSHPTDDLPYMTETPASGTVGAGSSQVVAVGFDTNTSTKFGLHAAQLTVSNSTPYGPQAVGTLLTKAFLDVPVGSFGDNEIHGLAGARITYGVAGNMYAPNDTVSRAQMAVFLTRSTQGYAFIPPFPGPGFNTFADVTYDYWAANYIEFIYNPAAHAAANPIPQLTTGCSLSPFNYCPDLPTTRGEMSVFVTRAAFGGSQYLAASPVFSDVPAGHVYRGFIEKMWQTGVSSGCGGGQFCPDRPITRAEMAIFLVRAFNIPYLH